MGDFLRSKHIMFFKNTLNVVPYHLSSMDTLRLTVAFFAISGLDLLNALNTIESQRKKMIDWIYSLMLIIKEPDGQVRSGFRGSSADGYSSKISRSNQVLYDSSQIPQTYTGLSCLLILGDDLSRIDRKTIIKGVRILQQKNGSFSSLVDGSESDMRFLYCAVAVCYILNDWSGIDKELAINYIVNSLSYEGAFGQGPGMEAHGGSTFCAVASLALMNCLDDVLTPKMKQRLIYWCLMKQDEGFNGRPNKPEDTCYSFWVGATLKILGAYQFVNFERNLSFLLSTQDNVTGGLSKWPDKNPDPLHTYLGIGGLALMNIGQLAPIHPALNISSRAAEHLAKLQESWKSKDA